jgi:hypothetical protein
MTDEARPEETGAPDSAPTTEDERQPLAWEGYDGTALLNVAYRIDQVVSQTAANLSTLDALAEEGVDLTRPEFYTDLRVSQHEANLVVLGLTLVGLFIPEKVPEDRKLLADLARRFMDDADARAGALPETILEEVKEAQVRIAEKQRKAMFAEMGFSEEEVEALTRQAAEDATPDDGSQN